MPSPDQTVQSILAAPTMDDRVARIRLIPQHHGTVEHAGLYAAVAKEAYVPYLAPDYSYFFEPPFYTAAFFSHVYARASAATNAFRDVTRHELETALLADPQILLVLRTITGLLKNEFSDATGIVADRLGLSPASISSAKIDTIEKSASAVQPAQATLLAATVEHIMDGTLFGSPAVPKVKSKQDKADTETGWTSVRHFADYDVPYSTFLHQRHYGGSFRQVLDATSTQRGDLIEDAVEDLFRQHGLDYIRTGSHNQAGAYRQFGIQVTPAPDFIVYDQSGLRAMLECKGTNDGGTARDKALRFKTLHAESLRLGGIPLMAVLGGLGWRRTNDALGPVIRDCEGRVFTLSTLSEMMSTFPFPGLVRLPTP